MAKDVKYGDINIPGIPADEPVFVFRAQDILAGAPLLVYRELRASMGIVPDSVNLSISRFQAWPTKRLPT